MPSCRPLLAMFLSLFASVLCGAQTATCTSWKFFKAPAPWASDPSGINRWGTVVGSAKNPSQVFYGYIRYSNGAFNTYMAPNASLTSFVRRNAQGVTVGFYDDTSATPETHGLVVSGSSVATVDYPGAVRTQLAGINYWGTIVGTYTDSSRSRSDGFKLKNGVFTRIQYPGSTTTYVSNISDTGVIVGIYFDQVFPSRHGFILDQGVYKTLDNPNGSVGNGGGTILTDINSSGAIVGYYLVGSNAYSFIYGNGVFKDIKPPNGTYTRVTGINGYGYVTGSTFTPTFTDSNYKSFTAHCQ